MAELVRSCQGFFGFGEPVLLSEEHPELERSVDNAAVVGAAVRGRSTGDVAALFEQQAEVVGGGAMAELVRSCQGFFGFGEMVLLGELDAELERRLRTVPLIDGTIRCHGISQVASPIVLV